MSAAAFLPPLQSGGLITNYYCTSRCAHCLYCSSPGWERQYINPMVAERNLAKARAAGCRSMHIGGGEPFLSINGLKDVIALFGPAGMGLDYVETNSSWFRNHEDAVAKLLLLKKAGLRTLLVSISPFHTEHIPFKKVEGVMRACEKTGIGIFPWVEGFIEEIKNLGIEKTHSLDEFEEAFGPGYVSSIPGRYWVSMKGRALFTFAPYMPETETEEILAAHPGPCGELKDTSHFHMDLFGSYVPGLCPGLALGVEDVTSFIAAPRSSSEYPFLSILGIEGINGLLEAVLGEYGFEPKETYVSKCAICFDIRRFLVVEKRVESRDLSPADHYRQI